MSSTPRLKLMRFSLFGIRSVSEVSKSISPVENMNFALSTAISCLGVGSKVSGLALAGTKISILKSNQILSM